MIKIRLKIKTKFGMTRAQEMDTSLAFTGQINNISYISCRDGSKTPLFGITEKKKLFKVKRLKDRDHKRS